MKHGEDLERIARPAGTRPKSQSVVSGLLSKKAAKSFESACNTIIPSAKRIFTVNTRQ
jgi:hypothetical protein